MSDVVMSMRTARLADRRGVAILAGSVVLHALVLAVMALRLFEPERTDPPIVPTPPIFVEIEPRPLLEGEAARVPAPSASPSAVPDTRPLTAPTAIVRAPTLNPEDEEEDDRPSAPSPRLSPGSANAATSGTPGAGADNGAWQVRPEGLGAQVGRAMRLGAGGCRIMDGRLNPTEQAICDEEFNAAAAAAAGRPIGSRTLTPAEIRREAQFARDGAAALRSYEARRAPLRSGVGVVTSGEGVGGNFGTGTAGAHLDPSFRDGADNLLRQDSNKLTGPRRLRGLTPPRPADD